MKSIRLLFAPAVAAFVAVGALGACSSQSPNAITPTTNAATPNAAVADTHAHVPLLEGAWKLADLSSDQEVKLQAIEDQLRAAMHPRVVAQRELAEIFAQSLEAGQLDESAANAKIDQIAKLADAEKGATADALNAVHALLTPAQRTAVVQLTKDGWKNHHDGDKAGVHDGFHGHEGGFGMHMKEVAESLNLSDAQKQAFHDEMASMPHPDKSKFEAMKAKMKAAGDAFVGDSFDAKALGIGDKKAEMAQTFATRMEKMIGAAIKILDANQRTTLAAKIREHAAKMSF